MSPEFIECMSLPEGTIFYQVKYSRNDPFYVCITVVPPLILSLKASSTCFISYQTAVCKLLKTLHGYINTSEGKKTSVFHLTASDPMYNACCLGQKTCYCFQSLLLLGSNMLTYALSLHLHLPE